MAHTTVLPQPQILSQKATCADCPFFNDYDEPRGRGWCSAFDRLAYRHHRATDGCRLALKPLLSSQPVTVMVELASHEFDSNQNYLVPLHDFITEVEVSKPSLQEVEKAIRKRISQSERALLGYSHESTIVRHWIPQNEDEF